MGFDYKTTPVRGFKADDSEEGVVEAIVAVTGIKDNVNDIIIPGAFQKTLLKRTPKGVWHHNITESVSRTEQVKELLPGDPELPDKLPDGTPWPREAGALKVKTRFNLRTTRGREAYEDVKFFDTDQEWSIGYNVPTGGATFDRKTGTRNIHHMDLYEYSPVLFGAMPNARTVSVKSAQFGWKQLCGADDEEIKTLLAELETKSAEAHAAAHEDWEQEVKKERTIRTEAGARRYGKRVGDTYGNHTADDRAESYRLNSKKPARVGSGKPGSRMEEDESPRTGARGGKLVEYDGGVARYDDGTFTDGSTWRVYKDAVEKAPNQPATRATTRARGRGSVRKADDELIYDLDLKGFVAADETEDDDEKDEDDYQTDEGGDASAQEDWDDEEDDDDEEKSFVIDFTKADAIENAIVALTQLRDVMLDGIGRKAMDLEGGLETKEDNLTVLVKDAGLEAVADTASDFDAAVQSRDLDAMEETGTDILDAVDAALEDPEVDKDKLKAVTAHVASAFQQVEAEEGGPEGETEETEDDSKPSEEKDEEKSGTFVIDTKSLAGLFED